jgi:TolB-like protein/DNA-binding winged helix-turn-helix (wHTH) protein/Tfp pilus assembly protein PilF
MEESLVPQVVRFGLFEVYLPARELRKRGLKVRLQEQPFQVLAALLERRGEVVTREELRQRIWPADTFVDFDNGLNGAISRLRETLGDSVDSPRFVETVPRRGYRFIAPVEVHSSAGSEGTAAGPPAVSGANRRWRAWAATAALAGLVGLLAALDPIGLRERLLARTAPVPIRSIAVLPFENLSGDTAQEYFVDGMTDALVTDLGRIGGLRVISRTSAMHYKGTRKTLPEIARELNVDATVEGAVLRSGDRVRITAQLIRAPSDEHLWSEEFQGEARDVLTLQNDVTRAIAAQIRAKLTPRQNPQTTNSEAYEYYLKGRYNLFERFSKEGFGNAIHYFEMAIEKDPSYAPPYAGLARAYALGYFQRSELSPREAWSKATVAATKALELDDQLAEGHIAMANVRFRFDWNWPEAEREFKRGLELNPNDAFAHTAYGLFLGITGRLDEALAEATLALNLDPLAPQVREVREVIYSWSGRLDDAIAESRRTLELYPDFVSAHSALATNYEKKELYAQAESEWLKFFADRPEQVESLRKAFAASGIRGFWEKRLELEKRRLNPDYFTIARLCVQLGRKDEAFGWLEKAFEARYPTMPNIKVAIWLDPVRSDPRHADLLRRVGLPP